MHTGIPATIASRIDSGWPLLLDGGLGGELDRRGFDISTPLWSAELINSAPATLRALHLDFLEAGAMCITTASYQASEPGLAALGMGRDAIESVFRDSVAIARAARDEFLQSHPTPRFRPLVAASVGPYGAYLADGSEYRGNYGQSDAALRAFHTARLGWLDRSGADLIACETIPDLQEARVLAGLLERLTTPAWISFCCRDGRSLHDGNAIEAAAELFKNHARCFALGVNCCAPADVGALIERIAAVAPHKLIVVYPNSGQQYDAEAKHWRGDQAPRHYSELAAGWFQAGAGMIGGCCRIGPEYIRELAARRTWPC